MDILITLKKVHKNHKPRQARSKWGRTWLGYLEMLRGKQAEKKDEDELRMKCRHEKKKQRERDKAGAKQRGRKCKV